MSRPPGVQTWRWWWPLRRRYLRCLHWVRWQQQGRPRDVPVVLGKGRLIVRPDGGRVVEGWGFDSSRMTTWVDVEGIWEYLALSYPETIEAPWTRPSMTHGAAR